MHQTSEIARPRLRHVSTADQDLSGQVERLTQKGAARVFEDVVSGKTFERPGLAALLDYARPGGPLAVIRLDRLGRSLAELLKQAEDLKACEINLISLKEQIDTTSAAGEHVFHVFGAIVHFERRLIAERTKDGLAAARKRGRTPGRPPLKSETISALQKLVEAGTSVSQAAKHLGIGRSTAYKLELEFPRFDGAILSQEWKEALWDKFVTGAPRTITRQAISVRNLPGGHARRQSCNTAIHCPAGYCAANVPRGALRSRS